MARRRADTSKNWPSAVLRYAPGGLGEVPTRIGSVSFPWGRASKDPSSSSIPKLAIDAFNSEPKFTSGRALPPPNRRPSSTCFAWLHSDGTFQVLLSKHAVTPIGKIVLQADAVSIGKLLSFQLGVLIGSNLHQSRCRPCLHSQH
jgi:hypothetical protein